MLQKEVSICKILQNICVNVYDVHYEEPWHPTPSSGYRSSGYNPCSMGYWYGNGSTVFNYQCTIGSKNISLTANVNRTKGFTADRNPANFGIQVLHNGVYQRDIYYARRTHKEIPEVFIFPFPVTHYYGGAWFTLGINPRKHFIHVYNYSNGYREYKLSYGGNPCTYAYIDDYDRICGNYNRGENCIVLSGWGICLINGPYGDSSDFGELGYYPKSYQMSVFPR